MTARIAIVVPSGDMCHADFAMCLARMTASMTADRMQFAVVNPRCSLIQKGRYEGVIAAKKIDATHILMIDSDMTFPPHTALSLLWRDKNVVGTLCHRRRAPYELIGTKAGTRKSRPFRHTDFNTGLQKAGRLGTGVMMIKTSVFADDKAPWFNVSFSGGRWTSEDENFCDGQVVWCDTDLSAEIGHIGTLEIKKLPDDH
jgi:hypothetical protein